MAAGAIRTGIPYIRGGVGSYIDTGITPDSTTRVIVWARNFNPNSAYFFGSRVAYGNSAFYIAANTTTNSCRLSITYGNADSLYPTSGTHEAYLSNYHKYELNGPKLYVDDTLVATSTGTFTGNNLNIHLLGLNNNGTHESMSVPADICACKIYKGGVLVRDFTPVESPNVGLYDAISDTVFTNAGTGSFTYGAFNPNAYKPLEYIVASGAAAFTTPAIGSYALPIVIKFKPTGTSKAWFSPLGGRTETERCEISTGNLSYSNCRLYSVLGNAESSTTMYNSTTVGAVRKDLVVVKTRNTFTAYYNKATFGSAATFDVASSYSTGTKIGVGATFLDYTGNPHWGSYFVGNIYYVGLGDCCNLVPAKISGVAGMYDTYNDTFYQSITSTHFTAGPEL